MINLLIVPITKSIRQRKVPSQSKHDQKTGKSQAVELYEIARYETLIAWAKQRGLTVSIASPAMDIRKEARDQKLTRLAKTIANANAESAATISARSRRLVGLPGRAGAGE